MEMNPVEDSFIESPHGKIHYRYSGKGRSGIPLLVLHGGPGASCGYLHNLEKLSDERPVLLYDQLGCGCSDRNPDKALWSTEYFVKELDFVRNKLFGNEYIYILGQSWGTTLAVLYMLNMRPVGIKGLVLVSPCLSAPLFEADQRRLLFSLPGGIGNTVADCDSRGDSESEIYQTGMDTFYRNFLCRLDPWPESLNATFGNMNSEMYKYMWGSSEFTVSGTLKNLDLCGRLGTIKEPVLLTCGRFDESTPETTSYYKSCMPHSEIRIFEDASHFHHVEKEKEFLETLRNFLCRND